MTLFYLSILYLRGLCGTWPGNLLLFVLLAIWCSWWRAWSLQFLTVSLWRYPGHTAACLLDGGTSPSKSDRRFGARADGPAHSHHPLCKPNRQGRHTSPALFKPAPFLLVLFCICASKRRQGAVVWSGSIIIICEWTDERWMSAVMEATTLRPVNPPQHTHANYSI